MKKHDNALSTQPVNTGALFTSASLHYPWTWAMW